MINMLKSIKRNILRMWDKVSDAVTDYTLDLDEEVLEQIDVAGDEIDEMPDFSEQIKEELSHTVIQ